MSMKVTFKTRGFMGGSQMLRELAQEIGKGFPETFPAAAQKTLQAMRNLAPIRTGFLRNNIQLITASGTEIVFISAARYSAFVEYGTWKMPARPFFFPPIQTVLIPELKKAREEIMKKIHAKARKGANSTP
jgi:bacteriophage HK97-gp10 putative tail-component